MSTPRLVAARPWAARLPLVAVVLLALVRPALAGASKGDAPSLSPALEKAVPENVADLKAIQEQVKNVVDKVLQCTVNVRIGSGQGSGVIVSEDGYVLTAAHVSGAADRDVVVTLPDGRHLKGKTLGANQRVDAGLIKITDKGKWPYVEMANSADLKRGQWCVAVGHPGGLRKDRPPVVRLGRVLESNNSLIQSDCTLVGGDSGGPLFDLQGKVIGIHSRIGGSIAANIHVPVAAYRDDWERLLKSEVWGGFFAFGKKNPSYLGVKGDPDADTCKISEVVPGSPAEKAGFKADDVVTRFGGKKIATFEELVDQVSARKPGDEVMVDVVRGDATVTLRVVIGKRPEE